MREVCATALRALVSRFFIHGPAESDPLLSSWVRYKSEIGQTEIAKWLAHIGASSHLAACEAGGRCGYVPNTRATLLEEVF